MDPSCKPNINSSCYCRKKLEMTIIVAKTADRSKRAKRRRKIKLQNISHSFKVRNWTNFFRPSPAIPRWLICTIEMVICSHATCENKNWGKKKSKRNR